jgi:hypothetical protein
MDEKNVQVTFANGVLTIKGEKQEEREEKKKGYHMRERSSGSYLHPYWHRAPSPRLIGRAWPGLLAGSRRKSGVNSLGVGGITRSEPLAEHHPKALRDA